MEKRVSYETAVQRVEAGKARVDGPKGGGVGVFLRELLGGGSGSRNGSDVGSRLDAIKEDLEGITETKREIKSELDRIYLAGAYIRGDCSDRIDDMRRYEDDPRRAAGLLDNLRKLAVMQAKNLGDHETAKEGVVKHLVGDSDELQKDENVRTERAGRFYFGPGPRVQAMDSQETAQQAEQNAARQRNNEDWWEAGHGWS